MCNASIHANTLEPCVLTLISDFDSPGNRLSGTSFLFMRAAFLISFRASSLRPSASNQRGDSPSRLKTVNRHNMYVQYNK